MKKCLVLGGNGFIGKAIVNLLLSLDYKVRVFSNIEIEIPLEQSNFEQIIGDFTQLPSFSTLLDGVDVVIHLISTTIPSEDTTIIPREIGDNIIPTVRLLEDLKYNPGIKLLFASSAGTIYGETGEHINQVSDNLEPICSYGVQKLVIEKYLEFYGRKYGLDYRILRITNPYGWGQDSNKVQGLIPIFVRKILANEGITIYGKGDNVRDFIFIEDLAEAFVKVINYQGGQRVFNIGYGEFYSINHIVALIERETKLKFSSINYIARRSCDVYHSYVDLLSSQELLNWKPKTSIETGLRKTIDFISNNSDA